MANLFTGIGASDVFFFFSRLLPVGDGDGSCLGRIGLALRVQTCAAVDVEEHVWDLEESRGLVGSSDSSEGGNDDSGGIEMAGRATEAGAGARRDSHEDDASWMGSGSDTASWRGSGSALLSHLGLSSSSSMAPSR